ncbi:MAG: ABC transporter substrate-binding protein [Chloroflexi bacterium]|nr:ABC transporter substrate-binding protein [Chloroflexota bacterium]
MNGKLSRRAALRLLAPAAGAAVVVACSGPGLAPPSAPTSAPTSSGTAAAGAPAASAATPAAAPKTGGTLRIGLASEPANVDGHIRTPGSDLTYWLAFDRLIDYDDKAQPQPGLAETWDVAPDYKSVTFHLRKGVTYHSGREFTSDDVKWNFLRVRDPKLSGSTLGAYSLWWSSIDTPDKYTVTLKSDLPRPTLFDSLQLFNMLDQPSMEGPDAKSSAVGTGPFVMQEWVQGDHFTFTKNKNYWKSGKPYLDGLQSRVFRGEQPAMAELEGGTIDAMRMTSVADVVRLKADPKYAILEHPNPGTFYELGFSVPKPPFDNKVLRQAFNYAFNRHYLAQTIFQGTAVPSALPWSTSSPAYQADKSNAYAFDLDKAKSLLAQANVSDLELEVAIQSGQGLIESMLQVYQADLAKLGIKLNINLMEAAAWIDRVNNVKYTGLYFSGDNNAHVNPGTLWSSSPGWRPVPGNNSGWKDDEWTQLVTGLVTEPDPAKQKVMIPQMNDFVLDRSWIFAISSNPAILVTARNVQGLVPALYNGWFFDGATLT